MTINNGDDNDRNDDSDDGDNRDDHCIILDNKFQIKGNLRCW